MNTIAMRPARLRKALAITLGLGAALIAPSLVLGQTFPGAGLGAIPDNDPVTGLNTTFAVSGITGGIADLQVSITFAPAHTWAGDVTATLIAPGGSPSFPLFGNIGSTTAGGAGDSSDLAGPYVFVDPAVAGSGNIWTAAGAVAGAAPIAAGTYFTTPVGGAGAVNPPAATALNAAFAALTPAQINGTWTLNFTDSANLDTGTVSATQLTLTQAAAPITSTPASGVTINLPPFTVGGVATTALINFQNPGTGAGTVTCTQPAATEFTVSPIPLSVPAAGNADVVVSFSSAAPGAFAGTLNCTGSGGENFSYPLSATAVAAPVVLAPAAIPTLGHLERLLLVFGVLGLGLMLVRHRAS